MKTYVYFITAVSVLLLGSREASAQTDIQGVINQNTTLTADKSPYRIMGDIFVESGVTLTVEAGVDIIFWDYYSIFVSGEFKTAGAASGLVYIYGQQVQGNTFVLWKGIIAQTLQAKISLNYTSIANAEVAVNYSGIQHTGTWTPPQLDIRNSYFETNFTGIAGHSKGVAGVVTGCFFTQNAIGFSGLTDSLAYNPRALFMPAGTELENCTFRNNNIGASRALKLSACWFENNRKAAMMEGGEIKDTYFLNNDSGLVTHSSVTENCRFDGNRLAYYHLPLNPSPGPLPGAITVQECAFRYNTRGMVIDTASGIQAISCNRFLSNAVSVSMPALFFPQGTIAADSFMFTGNSITLSDTAVYISNPEPERPASSPDTVRLRFIANRIDENSGFNFYNASVRDFNLFENYLGSDSNTIESRLFDGTDDASVGYVSYEIPASIQFVTGGYNVTMAHAVIKSASGKVVSPSTDTWFGQECLAFNVSTGETLTSGSLYTVYPNPFGSELIIGRAGETNGEDVTIRLYDITGRSVLVKTIAGTDVPDTGIQLDTEGLGPGLYILHIRSGGYSQNNKLVK